MKRHERPPSSPLGPVLSLLLLPLALVYGFLARWRALFYRLGLFRTRHLGRPVISVGNLTAGGSGKTPLVEFLARQIAELGQRPAVLTRGYRRFGASDLIRVRSAEHADPATIGDEPFWLASRNPDLLLYLGTDRAKAGRLGEAMDAPGLFLLDDGFQHLALHRDLNLLLVDASRGLGNGWVLPSGWLREPPSAARRADAVIVTQANLGDPERVEADFARRTGWRGPLFRFGYEPAGLARLDGGAKLPVQALAGRRVSMLCAIARPESFAAALRGLGTEPAERIALRDHDPYEDPTLADVERRLQGASAEAPDWVTTEKDAVKLKGRLKSAQRLWVLEMKVVPDPRWEGFFLESLIRQRVVRHERKD
jgi:tetraacyldisaccharide 4'-kinase